MKKIFPKLEERSDVVKTQSEVITQMSTVEELLQKLCEFRDGEEIEEECFAIYNYYANSEEWKDKLKNSLKALNYNIETEKIDTENIQKLYGDTLKTSVSRLEQYRSCPFSYYLKYGLNLSERQEFKVQALDTGSFMHDVIDSFFDKLQERDIKIKGLEQEDIDKIVDEIINEKLSLKKNYFFRKFFYF